MKITDAQKLIQICGGSALTQGMIGSFLGIAAAAFLRFSIGAYATYCNNRPYNDAYSQGYKEGYAGAKVTTQHVVLTFNDGFREGLNAGRIYRQTYGVEKNLLEPSAPPMPIPTAIAYPI